MDLFDTLASFGLTTKVLQIVIIGSIAIFLIGMYWRFIVIGAGILFCVMVFASPSKTVSSVESEVKSVEQKVEKIEHPADVAPSEFIEDCIRLNDNATKSSCQKMWKESNE
jgi:hypothetical protein